MASDWPRTFFTARLFLFSINSSALYSSTLVIKLYSCFFSQNFYCNTIGQSSFISLKFSNVEMVKHLLPFNEWQIQLFFGMNT